MKPKDVENCGICDRGVMHGESIVFYRLKIDTMVVDWAAAKRLDKLEDDLGGDAAKALEVGPDEAIAWESSSREMLVCTACLRSPISHVLIPGHVG